MPGMRASNLADGENGVTSNTASATRLVAGDLSGRRRRAIQGASRQVPIRIIRVNQGVPDDARHSHVLDRQGDPSPAKRCSDEV